MVDAGAVPFLSALIPHHDAQLKRQVCSCLANIARHTIDLAEHVVEAEIFPKILYRLKDTDPLVRLLADMGGFYISKIGSSQPLAFVRLQSNLRT